MDGSWHTTLVLLAALLGASFSDGFVGVLQCSHRRGILVRAVF
jgi:hypothetical protein